jgi:hypothetical protein
VHGLVFDFGLRPISGLVDGTYQLAAYACASKRLEARRSALSSEGTLPARSAQLAALMPSPHPLRPVIVMAVANSPS